MDAVAANFFQSPSLLRQTSERLIFSTPNCPGFMRIGSGPQFRLRVCLHSTAFGLLNPRQQLTFIAFPNHVCLCLIYPIIVYLPTKFDNSDSVLKK